MRNKGITLIALVVTVIVLIILSGVVITMLTGESGILTQVQNAKIVTEISQMKEEWNIKKTELEIEEINTEDINVSGEDVKNYIKSMPNNWVKKISIEKGELAYDINQCSEEEQLMLKSDYGFKAVGDNVAPYGSIEKKIKDGKVQITVYSADDESDVDEIILPDGSCKKIQYDTENILVKGTLFKAEGITKETVGKYFKNITIDENNQIAELSEVEKYNVILDLNAYAQPYDYKFLNRCFEHGKNLITSGNDSKEKLSIIEKSTEEADNVYVQIDKENEVTKYYNPIPGRDSLTVIQFRDNTDIWCTSTVGGLNGDAVGEYESENGNRWIHHHVGELKNSVLYYRNAIYRITGSRSATYEVDKNGTYKFIIKDLSGNETEISTEVTEL